MSEPPVVPRRAALVAGLLAACFSGALFLVRPVPDRVLAMLGGPDGGVARHGGARIRYLPPQGHDVELLARHLGSSTVRRDGKALVIELPGIARDQLPAIEDMFVAGGLEMREALESRYATELAEGDPAIVDATQQDRELDDAVYLDLDQWRAEDSLHHQAFYLESSSRVALERAIEAAYARGWRPTPGATIMLERIEPWAESRDRRGKWRTYELASEVLIEGTMIERAIGAISPYDDRPIVLLDFTAEGATRFCDATERIQGHKVATVLGGVIRSAPIINGPICGGRASISMGGSELENQLHERDALVAVLSTGALPPGGSIDESRWSPAPDVRGLEWLGRALLALIAGVLFGLVTVLVVRIARPHRSAASALPTGAWPIRRIFVTALAPVALVLAGWVPVPGVEIEALAETIYHHGGDDAMMRLFDVDALGLTPVLAAFALVELVALIVPRWRRLRHLPTGRVRLGQAVAVLAIVLALLQSWFVASYLQSLGVMDHGAVARLTVMASLVSATLLLAFVAGVVREHGLGNGYAALVVAGWGILVAGRALDGELTAGHALGLAACVVVAVGTACVVRWRIGAAREVTLRVPTSGLSPITSAGGFVQVISMLWVFGMSTDVLSGWVVELHAREWLTIGLVAGLVPVWSWIFARPKLVAGVAVRAGLVPPQLATWRRATLLSLFLLVAIGAVTAFATTAHADVVKLFDPVTAMLAGVVVLDLFADARAHRADLEPAWVLHQLQYAGAIERVLTDAGIPYHLHASHVRSLLASVRSRRSS